MGLAGHDIATMRWLLERQLEIFEAMGAKKVRAQPAESFSMSRRLMGTCRMGLDSERSMVDPFGRTHDVRNLFVAAISSPPRASSRPP